MTAPTPAWLADLIRYTEQSFGFRGNEPLDTRPPELWVDLVHDECGGDW